MRAEIVLHRLRRYLLWLAGLMCSGTLLELVVTEHWDGPIQSLPFALCGLSLVGIVWVLVWPGRNAIYGLRWVLGITLIGSLFGIFEHIEHNWAFALEIRPNAAAGDVVWEALTGANPLLAPGILAFMAMIALGATYDHPVLQKQTERLQHSRYPQEQEMV